MGKKDLCLLNHYEDDLYDDSDDEEIDLGLPLSAKLINKPTDVVEFCPNLLKKYPITLNYVIPCIAECCDSSCYCDCFYFSLDNCSPDYMSLVLKFISVKEKYDQNFCEVMSQTSADHLIRNFYDLCTYRTQWLLLYFDFVRDNRREAYRRDRQELADPWEISFKDFFQTYFSYNENFYPFTDFYSVPHLYTIQYD